MSFVGAFAVAGDLLGQRERDVVELRPRRSARSTGPAAPLAMMAAVSLVDVSVSMLTALRVRSITRRNITSRATLSRRVGQNSVMSVAMSGSIMPTPFAMPTTVAAPADADATFANVSVVMMPARRRLGLDDRRTARRSAGEMRRARCPSGSGGR